MAYYSEQRNNDLLPPVIKNLLIANGMLFFFQAFFENRGGEVLVKFFALWPLGMDQAAKAAGYAGSDVMFYPWQLISYGFLHGGIGHILVNMLALWMFGREIEINWGSKRFAIYYFICIFGAGLIQLIVSTLMFSNTGQPVPTLGASGGTFGILLAFGMMFPYRRIMLLFPPIPMEARWFVIIFGALELVQGLGMPRSGVAHFAHLGGMLFGFILILYWRGKLPIKPKYKIHW